MLLLRLVATETPKTNEELAQVTRAALRTIEAGFASYSLYGRSPTIEEYLRLGNTEAAQWSRLCSDLLAQQNPIDAERALIVVITPNNHSFDEQLPLVIPNLNEPYIRSQDSYIPSWQQSTPQQGYSTNQGGQSYQPYQPYQPDSFSPSFPSNQNQNSVFSDQSVSQSSQHWQNATNGVWEKPPPNYYDSPKVVTPVCPWSAGVWPDTSNNAPPANWTKIPKQSAPASHQNVPSTSSNIPVSTITGPQKPPTIPPVTLGGETTQTVVTVETPTTIHDLKDLTKKTTQKSATFKVPKGRVGRTRILRKSKLIVRTDCDTPTTTQ